MEELLDDKSTYRKLRIDPTVRLQKENNIITEMFSNQCIKEWQKKPLICTPRIAPRFYGQPKIQKTGTPFKPKVSSEQVPCYALSKHIVEILENTESKDLNIKKFH